MMTVGIRRLNILTGLLVAVTFGGSATAGEQPLDVDGGRLVQQGAHLARLADCMGCHTYKEDKPYAGNKPMESPFGTFYTSNLTQDKETGLGSWSYSDFKRALHEGISKDDSYIYPAMPFVSYTKLLDRDVKALWAYFQTIKPIRNEVREPDLAVIGDNLSGRAALLAWRVPFFEAGRFEAEPDRSDTYTQGAYYVQALGHCSSCHTPRNVAFAQNKDEFLNGFTLNGWYAPRISPGPRSAVGKWNAEELTDYLKKGEVGKQNIAVGPMNEVWHDSLRHLPREDLHAISVYLKEMPKNNNGPEREQIAISPEQQTLGKTVYNENCKSCHAANGQGEYGVAPALAGNNLVYAQESNSVVMALLVGFDPKNVWGAMPSYAQDLSNEELAAVTNYVRTAWNNNAPADATVDMVISSRPHAAKDIPPSGQRAAVICQNLPAKIIRAALKTGDRKMLSAYDDKPRLQNIVSSYRSARRPDAPKEDTVNALSSAYCRALVKQKPASEDENKARVAEFSQKVANLVGVKVKPTKP